MTEEETKEKLYQEGLNYFKSGDYFEAHESWEDLWSDFYLEDRKFIQVFCVHKDLLITLRK